MSLRTLTIVVISLLFALTFLAASLSHAQTAETPTHGVIRLKVKYKPAGAPKDKDPPKEKELARKRFFLIKGTLEDNKSLIETIKQASVPSRECYYRSKGASDALIKWLKENDCESVYCRQIDEKYLSGSESVPEFQAAYNQGLAEFKNAEVARRWLTVNLAPDIRAGFYSQKQETVNALIAQAEAATNAGVMSVMTDRKGSAYLTNIEPGTYTISNLVASETERTSILWICEKEVKAVDPGAMRRLFTLSSEKDPKVKCEVVKRPLPVCESRVSRK